MIKICGSCAWAEAFIPADEDEPAMLQCRFPTKRLPFCMQGVAQREREPVRADLFGCPCWTSAQT